MKNVIQTPSSTVRDGEHLFLKRKLRFGSGRELVELGCGKKLAAKIAQTRQVRTGSLAWQNAVFECKRTAEDGMGKWQDRVRGIVTNCNADWSVEFTFVAWMAPADSGLGKPRRLLLELVDEADLDCSRR